jgi:hypothetical protein
MSANPQQQPFLVLGLPRSRTAWLSRFLTYGDHICGHEQLRYMRSLDDVKAWFQQPHIGSAETAAAPFWRLIGKVAPDCKIVVVRRPAHEVFASLTNLGIPFDGDTLGKSLRRLNRKLDQIEARLDVLTVNYADLATEATCKAVFEHCLPYAFDADHWRSLQGVNIQCDMRAMMRYAVTHAQHLDKLAACAKHRILADMALKPSGDMEGMTFQVESVEDWQRDGRRLFEDHCALVGEDPREWTQKNWDLFRTIEQGGGMQITTARSNGRMFGYLMTLVSPSLVSAGITSAYNTTFYADPTFPGLGAKLQRESLAMLKKRGVHDVFFEAGSRGSGARIGSLYKRLGAHDHGQVYRLPLEA